MKTSMTVADEHVFIVYDEVHGDDANPGTLDLPVRSFQAANRRLPDAFCKKAGILNGTGLTLAEREEQWRMHVGEDIPYSLPLYRVVES